MGCSKLFVNDEIALPVFKIIADVASELDLKVWVVGGFVRDIFLKRSTKDIDFVCLGDAILLAQKIGKRLRKPVSIFKNFGTAMFRYEDIELEFASARKESYRSDSRKPIVEAGTLEDDQNRRDFTINALAISLNKEDYGKLLDPFNGLEDIENRIIRTPLEPEQTFSDDPLRMLRAIRFAAQLDFKIEEKTFAAISKMKQRMEIISKERIVEELNKILLSPKPSIGLELLDSSGLLPIIFPQLAALKGVEDLEGLRHKDNLLHTFQVVDNIAQKTDSLWLRWAALLHDIGKPTTKKFDPAVGWTFHAHDWVGSKMIPEIFRSLKLPLNEKMRYVQKLVAMHLRPFSLTNEQITDSAVRRLLVEAGEEFDDLMLLCEADITSKNPEKVKRFITSLEELRVKVSQVEEADRLRNWQPPVSGEVIMKTFGLAPSKLVGELKEAVREAILNGEVQDNYEAAFQYLIKIANDRGLKPVLKSE